MKTRHMHILILLLAGGVIYSKSVHGPFIFDDHMYIIDNPMIRNLGNFLDLSGTRYVSYLSFALNYAVGGYSTTGYHIVNIVIHIVNALLLYHIVAVTLETPRFRDARHTAQAAPFIASLLFIVHPVNTQAVSYITQRFASLAALFYLLSLFLYIKARLAEDRGRTALYICAIAAALIAQKTKETAFTLPVVTALYEFAFLDDGKTTAKRLLLLAPMLLTLAIIPLDLFAGGSAAGAGNVGRMIQNSQIEELRGLSRHNYLLTQFRVVTTYLRLLALPVSQKILYDYETSISIFDEGVLPSLLFLCLFLLSALYLFIRSLASGRARGMLVSFGVFWFFITISITSSVIPIKHVIFEHRLYLPGMGLMVSFAVLVCSAAESLKTRGMSRTGAGIRYVLVPLLAVSLATAAYMRNRLWADRVAFWQDAVQKAPHVAGTQSNLGGALLDDMRYSEAIPHLLEAIRIEPGGAEAHINLGGALIGVKRYREAIPHLLQAIRIDPGGAEARLNLGLALSKLGRKVEALREYNRALALKPDNAKGHVYLADLLALSGSFDEALLHYRRAIELRADYGQAHKNLGVVLRYMGRHGEAIVHLQDALALRPADAHLRYLTGLTLEALNRPGEAVTQYRKAIELKPDYTKPRERLSELSPGKPTHGPSQ